MPVEKGPHCSLVPLDLHDPTEYEEIRKQRIQCGWAYDQIWIDKWRDGIDQGVRWGFWIKLPDGTVVGHVSFDRQDYSDPPDLAIANPDGSCVTFHRFFILPAYRGLRLGRAVMDMLEDMATREPYGGPQCQSIVVCTLSRRYFHEEGSEWKGIWGQLGESIPDPGMSSEDWYRRRGYVWFDGFPEYPRTTVDGREIRLTSAYLRKQLPPHGTIQA